MNQERDKQESGVTPEFVKEISECQEALYLYIVPILGGDGETGKDILQEVNLRLWKQRDRFDPRRGSFFTWAKAIAREMVKAERTRAARENARTVYGDDVYEKMSTLAEAEQEPEDSRLVSLHFCMKKLDRADQRLIRSHYLDGRKTAELAAEAGTKAGKLRMRLSRLRDSLADCIRKRMCRIEKGVEREMPDADAFTDALEDVLEHGKASSQTHTLDVFLRDDAVLRSRCLRQQRMHALLLFDAMESRHAALLAHCRFLRWSRRASLAAALAVVLAGGWALLGRKQISSSGKPAQDFGSAMVADDSMQAEESSIQKNPQEHPEAVLPVAQNHPELFRLVSREPATKEAAEKTDATLPAARQDIVAAPRTVANQPTKEATQMNASATLAAAAAVAGILQTGQTRGAALPDGSCQTAGIIVEGTTQPTLFWRTCNTRGSQAVQIVWPPAVTNAELSIVRPDKTVTVPLTTNMTSYAFTPPKDAASESVLALTLNFFAKDGSLACAQTARVGLVRGVYSARNTLFKGPALPLSKWQNITAKTVVFPVRDGDASLLLTSPKGTVSTNTFPDIPGWHEWYPVSLGVNSLVLNAAEGSSSATVRRVPDGTVVMLR